MIDAMHDILYLHGFGTENPAACPVAKALHTAVAGIRLHTPCYHFGGHIETTRIGASLDAFADVVKASFSGKVHLVGYSFGGLLAALLAVRRPEMIGNVLLLAPAIDNYARNYEGRDPARWHMPREYVEELRTYPARPNIVRPTTLVHGRSDADREGSAPWRIQQWAEERPFRGVHFLDGVGHSLEPWLSAPARTSDQRGDVPTFQQLVRELICDR
jgi:pimeloyl-ACP methyl ester carboxylesterase